METEVVLVERLHEARTFLQRFQGLQFAKPLDSRTGLLLRNCKSIHTMWMRFAIDVFFISNEMTVLEIHRNVKPWRFVVPKSKGVSHVIEITSGWETQCEVGQRTEVLGIEKVKV
jgi:uncharacterized membrane protein (UPF0127 family)